MIARLGLMLVGVLAFWNKAWAVPLGFKTVPESTLPAAQQSERYYRDGLEQLVAGDLPGAERSFRKALENHPGSVGPLLGLAEIAFKRKQLDEAGALLQQAVKISPDNPYAQTSLGRYLRLKQQYLEAREAFRKAAALDPKAVEPRMALGDLELTVFGRAKEAVDAYQSALAIDPNRAAAHYALGIAEFKLGDSERAITELRRASELEPSNPLPLLELARIYVVLKKPDDALSAVNGALKIQPSLAEASLLRGDILLAKGDLSKAEAEYKRLALRYKQLAAPRLRLAMLYQQQGRTDAAIEWYRLAIQTDTQSALAYNNLAWLLSNQKPSLAEAERLARKAVELAPDVAQFYDTLAQIYRAEGKLSNSYSAMAKAAQLAPTDPMIIAHFGILQAECGDQAKAIELLEKALSQSKRFPGSAKAETVLESLRQEQAGGVKRRAADCGSAQP